MVYTFKVICFRADFVTSLSMNDSQEDALPISFYKLLNGTKLIMTRVFCYETKPFKYLAIHNIPNFVGVDCSFQNIEKYSYTFLYVLLSH